MGVCVAVDVTVFVGVDVVVAVTVDVVVPVTVAVGVCVSVAVRVAVGVRVEVDVGVGVHVIFGSSVVVTVGVSVTVFVGVNVGVVVIVAVTLGVGVHVIFGSSVEVAVDVRVSVGVAVIVSVKTGVAVSGADSVNDGAPVGDPVKGGTNWRGVAAKVIAGVTVRNGVGSGVTVEPLAMTVGWDSWVNVSVGTCASKVGVFSSSPLRSLNMLTPNRTNTPQATTISGKAMTNIPNKRRCRSDSSFNRPRWACTW